LVHLSIKSPVTTSTDLPPAHFTLFGVIVAPSISFAAASARASLSGSPCGSPIAKMSSGVSNWTTAGFFVQSRVATAAPLAALPQTIMVSMIPIEFRTVLCRMMVSLSY
jgi:hypothetical protein